MNFCADCANVRILGSAVLGVVAGEVNSRHDDRAGSAVEGDGADRLVRAEDMPAREAVKVLAAQDLPGLIVVDGRGRPLTVLAGTKVLRMALPYVGREIVERHGEPGQPPWTAFVPPEEDPSGLAWRREVAACTTAEWAKRWPSEEIWAARKRS